MSFMFEDKLFKRKLKVRKPSLNGIPHLFFCFVEHGTKLSHEPKYNSKCKIDGIEKECLGGKYERF